MTLKFLTDANFIAYTYRLITYGYETYKMFKCTAQY